MIFALGLLVCFSLDASEQLLYGLERLQAVYPDHIVAVIGNDIVWADNTHMQIGHTDPSKSRTDKINSPTLADQLEQPLYVTGCPADTPQDDPGRTRFERFFRKMYGDSPEEVERNLENVAWMPKVFGAAHILRVTKINTIHRKVQKISDELEELVKCYPAYVTFLNNPGGTFCWRNIANTNRLSNHSFGMTIDINAHASQYWQWDLKAEERPISEETELTYRNTIPWEIVEIFEKQGFVWGGKWYHYDTMHFEYRPELMVNQ